MRYRENIISRFFNIWRDFLFVIQNILKNKIYIFLSILIYTNSKSLLTVKRDVSMKYLSNIIKINVEYDEEVGEYGE